MKAEKCQSSWKWRGLREILEMIHSIKEKKVPSILFSELTFDTAVWSSRLNLPMNFEVFVCIFCLFWT